MIRIRRRCTVALALLGLLIVTPVTALAQVPSSIGSYVSYGYGSGVHTIAGSSAFPNFQNGAVDNRYPLAQVEQDASPASAARASYADTGPAGDTGGSQYNQSCSAANPPPPPSACQNPNNGVPYADSNYPGGPQSAHVDACSSGSPSPGQCPASRASSDSSELGANAGGFYAGGGSQPFQGSEGESHTIVSSDGTLKVTTHSEVQSFVIGTVEISKVVVDTIAKATNSTATADASVSVGSVMVDGRQVAITDQGLTVQQQAPVPCPSAPPGGGGGPFPSPPAGPSPAPGPTALPSTPVLPGDHEGCVPGVDVTYIQIFTVAPSRTVSGTHGTAWATGLHVKVTHPTPGAGVPQQSVEYVLGEGYADASTGAGGGGPAGFGSGDFGFGSGDFGFGGGPAADAGAGAGSAAANIASAVFSNRWWPLVLLFLTLEALLLGSAAAWVWARNAPVEETADEVLAP